MNIEQTSADVNDDNGAWADGSGSASSSAWDRSTGGSLPITPGSELHV